MCVSVSVSLHSEDCVFLCVSVYLSVCLSFCQSASLFICRVVCQSFCLYVCLCISVIACLSACVSRSLCLQLFLSTHLRNGVVFLFFKTIAFIAYFSWCMTSDASSRLSFPLIAAPTVAFGGLTNIITEGQIGVIEFIISCGAGGMFYSLFSGQPMTFVGPTGDIPL